jgi:hypothetical protein
LKLFLAKLYIKHFFIPFTHVHTLVKCIVRPSTYNVSPWGEVVNCLDIFLTLFLILLDRSSFIVCFRLEIC